MPGRDSRTTVAAPRRDNAHTVLRAAIGRGELPADLDLELASDLLIAPLGFRILVLSGDSDDAYLETLTNALEAALKAAAPAAAHQRNRARSAASHRA